MPLRLVGLNAKYYRSLEKCHLPELPPLSVLVGRNNAGKSNVVDILSFLHECSTIGVQEAVAKRGTQRRDLIIQKSDGRLVELEAIFEIPEQIRSGLFEIAFEAKREPLVKKLMGGRLLSQAKHYLCIGEGNFFEEVSIHGMDKDGPWIPIAAAEDARTRSGLRGGFQNELSAWDGRSPLEFSELKVSYSGGQPIDKIGFPGVTLESQNSIENAVVELIRESLQGVVQVGPALAESPELVPTEVTTIDPYSRNLVQLLFTLNNNDPQLFQRIERVVRSLVPELGKFRTLIRGGAVTFATEDPKAAGALYTYEELSQGTRRLLSITAAVFGAQDRGTVILEEPELHLHPSVQNQLARLLIEESQRIGIILTTHSAILASSVPRESLLLVRRGTEGHSVVIRDSEKHSVLDEIVSELGIRPSYSFEAEAVVFVEGSDDLGAYRTFARREGLENRVNFIDMEGAKNIQYYVNAKIIRARRAPQDVSAILDGDQETRNPGRGPVAISTDLGVPRDVVLCLSVEELESFFLDPAVVVGAFPDFVGSTADVSRLISKYSSEKGPKEVLHRVLRDAGVRAPFEEAYARLAEVLEPIPPEIHGFFEAISSRIN